jgi:plastocyanin
MRKSVSTKGVLVVMLLGVAVVGGRPSSFVASAQQKPNVVEVKIDNFSFGQMEITVPVGTTVTWTNRDDIPHTVVSTDEPRLFKSKALDTDEKFSFTFDKAGTYSYFCSIHPKMTAKVVVK